MARDLGITAVRVSQVIGLMNLATEILDYFDDLVATKAACI